MKIEIICPKCSKNGKIEVVEKVIKNSIRGITAIIVAENLVCNHSFTLYIDNNFILRDSFVNDYKVALPQIKKFKTISILDIPRTEEINTYLITRYISATELVHILRALFLKKKLLIINDLKILTPHLKNFIKVIFINTFEIDFLIMNRREYRNNENLYRKYLILDDKKIINDKKKEFSIINAKVESKIIEQYLFEESPKSALILLKNEIYKVYVLTQYIIEIIESQNDKKKLSKRELIKILEVKYDSKIKKVFFEFLLNILNNYYKYDITKSFF